MRKVAVFGGSFNPPGEHHRAIALELSRVFDEVIIVPAGTRVDKPIATDVDPIYRSAMADMAFRGIDKVRVELFDMEAGTFTTNAQFEEIFKSSGEVWHVVGSDLIEGGKQGKSAIQKIWDQGQRLWKDSRFAVIQRPDAKFDKADLPPHHLVIAIKETGSSEYIRDQLFHQHPIEGLVPLEVGRYIQRHGLYRGTRTARTTHLKLDEIRPMLVVDDHNPEALRLAASFPVTNASDPNLILCIGGDGAMLRAIRKYWRRRLPFYGVNAGHLGFLLNERPAALVPGRTLTLHQLPLLWVETETTTGERRSDFSFNDAWVERATGQTAWINVKVNGRDRLPQLMADAALVSTAAGSASYARAMGAQPLPFNTPALLLVGSNVLRPIGWKSAVLPLETYIELTALDPIKRPLNGYIDGVPQGNVVKMRVRLSHTAAVELVFEPEHDPAEKLAKIQFPTTI